ncbi:hypothetical protein MMC06_003786 [Schaereria dolodes]|nr:hypothetical protein [Schaereria dolodes]
MEQLVNPESSESSENSCQSNFFDIDFDMAEDMSPDTSGTLDPSPSITSMRQSQKAHQWRADPWRHSYKAPLLSQSCKQLIHSSRPDGEVISGIELLNLEGKASSHSVALTPTQSANTTPPILPLRRKTGFSAASPAALRQHEHRVSKSLTQLNCGSPKIMRPSLYSRHEPAPQAEVSDHYGQFNLDVPPSDLPLSPPPSTRVPQHEQHLQLIAPTRSSQRSPRSSRLTMTRSEPKLPRNQRMSGNLTYNDPIAQNGMTLQNRHSSALIRPTDHDFAIPPSQFHHDWPSISNLSPNYDSLFHDDQNPSGLPNQDFMRLSQELAAQGLMVDCEPYPNFLEGDEYFSAAPHDSFLTPTAEIFPNGGDDNTLGTAPQHELAPAPSSPTLLGQYHAPAPGPSTPTPKPHTRKPSTSTSSTSTRPLRRKSSTLKPPKTPTTPYPSSSTSHSNTDLSSPVPTPTAVSFVNFTPLDSARILHGVAPSGSSKTKARREKEATDKRRKLSAAACRLLMENGVDPASVVGEDLGWDLGLERGDG